MKIQARKDLTLKSWQYSDAGYWYRQVDPQPPPPFGKGYKQVIFVRIMLDSIALFQGHAKLAADGKLGPRTIEAIKAELEAKHEEASNYTWAWVIMFTKFSGMESMNDDIKRFTIEQEEDAKIYADQLITRVSKISAFL